MCWAHARRYFFELADIAELTKRRGKKRVVISPLALEAVQRIDRIFDIERAINGRSQAERLAVRQELAVPAVAELETWMREKRAALSRQDEVGKVMDYMLKDGVPLPPSSTTGGFASRTMLRKGLSETV